MSSVRIIRTALRLVLLAVLGLALAGCPRIYLSFEKHGGSFLATPKGERFEHLRDSEWDRSRNALVYFYRPYSDWAAEEIDAPTVYIDDNRYVNLRGNGYSWLEMAPGTRRLTMRRPLGAVLGFEGINDFALSLILDTEFVVEPGKVYYFRYSEVDEPEEINPDLESEDPLAQGPMRLVTRDMAFDEIVKTRLMLSRPPFAKNSAAASIVQDNIAYVFDQEEKAIKEARAEELALLKEAGHMRPGSWWCLKLCGGGPTRRLEADAQLKDLEKRRTAWRREMALDENNKPVKTGGKWWWPF